jgi:hypothetical protein
MTSQRTRSEPPSSFFVIIVNLDSKQMGMIIRNPLLPKQSTLFRNVHRPRY